MLTEFAEKFDTEILEYKDMFFWENAFDEARVEALLAEKKTTTDIEFSCNEIRVEDFYSALTQRERDEAADAIYFHIIGVFYGKGLSLNLDKYFNENNEPRLSFCQLERQA